MSEVICQECGGNPLSCGCCVDEEAGVAWSDDYDPEIAAEEIE